MTSPSAKAGRRRPRSHTVSPLRDRVLVPRGARFGIADWSEPPGSPRHPRTIAGLHVHRRDDELFFLLEGGLRFRVGERRIDARRGDAVFLPRAVPHAFANPGTVRARYLVVTSPNLFRMFEELESVEEGDRAAAQRIYARHHSALLE